MSDNKILYKQFLLELGRMVKSSSGRLVLLTYDRQSFKLVSLSFIVRELKVTHY